MDLLRRKLKAAYHHWRSAVDRYYGVNEAGDPILPHDVTEASDQEIPAHPLYYLAGAYLDWIHVAFQMLIGAGLIVALGWYAVHNVGLKDFTTQKFAKGIFDMAGAFLAASTVVELGWLLFTPGPDEALDPVILALATATLILAGQLTDANQNGIEVVAIVVTTSLLLVLLGARRTLIDQLSARRRSRTKPKPTS